MNKITAKPISGFPEWLPEERILEQRLLDIIRLNFERYGFSSIETSAVEKIEVLSAKGGNDKEIYGLRRLAAEAGSDTKNLALHFDLTVPLARYVAQNYHKLSFPFRRYQMQKVWRGERPQSGRYREFYQCDIDVIGDGELSLLTDAEIPSIIYRIFKDMQIGPFVISLSNRKILQGYFESLGVLSKKIPSALRIVDKIEKIGVSRVVSEMNKTIGISEENSKSLIDFISLDATNSEIIKELRQMEINQTFTTGVNDLCEVVEHMESLGVPEEYYRINMSIARGLDYYTGTVYETTLKDHPGIGSICSGGRFDDLSGHFTERKLPGVGISIGLTRLFSRLIKAEILKIGPSTTAPVLITSMDPSFMDYYFGIAIRLRDSGLNTEVFLESKKLGAQMKYANKKGFAFAVIAATQEIDAENVQLKNLKTGEQVLISCDELPQIINAGLQELRRQGLWV